MLDFASLDKVSSVVCKPTPTLTVKHVVDLHRTLGKSGETAGYSFFYDLSKKGDPVRGIPTKSNIGMTFTGPGYLVLETKRNSLDSKTGQVIIDTIKIPIYPRDIQAFVNLLNTAYIWLTNHGPEDVFVRDTENRPIQIRNPLLKMACPLSRFPEGITFKPCIIRDTMNVRYDGIAMGSVANGEITNFTASEFAGFKYIMEGTLTNLYLANLQLANNAMTYCIMQNQMELFSRKNS